jgi:hypothetical protein
MSEHSYTNERGNQVTHDFYGLRERYHYDFRRCIGADGWNQYDTTQDAPYFGIWVNLKARQIMTFVEGDEYLCVCPSAESFKAELRDMAQFYGPPPPHYDKRPGDDLIEI